jgi:hypothetical protein
MSLPNFKILILIMLKSKQLLGSFCKKMILSGLNISDYEEVNLRGLCYTLVYVPTLIYNVPTFAENVPTLVLNVPI